MKPFLLSLFIIFIPGYSHASDSRSRAMALNKEVFHALENIRTLDGEQDISYQLDLAKKEAIIVNGNNWSGELSIPSEITADGETFLVTGITDDAFNDCTELTKVYIPSSVRNILNTYSNQINNPFRKCTSLDVIEVDVSNQWLCAIDGILYNKDQSVLYTYPAHRMAESFEVPEVVKSVCRYAFYHNPNIKEIAFRGSSSGIGASAFADCTALEHVELPTGLSYLLANVFRNCVNLASIEIPAGVRGMSEQVFYGCSSLTSIELPEGLTEIGGLAFMNCNSLVSAILPSTLSLLPNGLFKGCSSLRDVKISSGIQRISGNAFENCTSLKVLDLPASITWFDTNSFKGCNMEALIIRGQLEGAKLDASSFYGMSTSTVIFAQPSEISKIKAVYSGKVLPLSQYNPTAIRDLPAQPAAEDSGSKVQVPGFKIYDLSGRRLGNGQLPKGIYIENGKKRVRK